MRQERMVNAWRHTGAFLVPPFRSLELHQQHNLHEFLQQVVEEGYGGIVVYNHPSKGEPTAVAKTLARTIPPETPMVIPIARHQVIPGVNFIAKRTNVTICPIVTEKTQKRAEEKLQPIPTLGEGSKDYFQAATKVLGRGGVVAVASHGTREVTLIKPTIAVMSTLAVHLRHNRDVRVMCVGVHVTDISRYQGGGTDKYHAFQRMHLNFGATFSVADILAYHHENRKTDRLAADTYILRRLATLVPEELRGDYR